ncbi:hypothetical protein FHX16_004973 [Rhizobium sp. BK661]|nr:hypothetical protein [Rhizobium sp. BK661]
MHFFRPVVALRLRKNPVQPVGRNSPPLLGPKQFPNYLFQIAALRSMEGSHTDVLSGRMSLRARQVKIGQWVVQMTCTMVLLLVGFAHQAPSFAKGTLAPAEFSRFILPDGTLPVLCSPDPGRMQKLDKVFAQVCEACRLSTSLLLPAPDPSRGSRLLAFAAAAPEFGSAMFPWRAPTPNMGPRAPPRP